jgi:hypothetical protein
MKVTVGNGCESSLTSEGTERMRGEKWCVLGYYPLSPNGTHQAWAVNGANVGNGKVGESPFSKLQFLRLHQFCDDGMKYR